jgi:hypothetical protein
MADERCMLQVGIGQGTKGIGSANDGGGDISGKREAPHDHASQLAN